MARVLVAEDEDDIRDLVEFVIGGAGHQVETASDGLDALRLYRPGAFDLLCIDLDMPRINGVGLTQAIRSHNDTVPILMVTGSATSADIAAAHESGIDALLKKPFSIQELRERVDMLLPSVSD